MLWSLIDALFPINPMNRENIEYFLRGYNLVDRPKDSEWIRATEVINDLLWDSETPFLTIRCVPIGDIVPPMEVTRENASLKAVLVSSAVICAPDTTLDDVREKWSSRWGCGQRRSGGEARVVMEPYRDRKGVTHLPTLNIISEPEKNIVCNLHAETENPWVIKVIEHPRKWIIADSMEVWVITEDPKTSGKTNCSTGPISTVKRGQDDYNLLIAEIKRRNVNMQNRVGKYSTHPLTPEYRHEFLNRTKPYYERSAAYWKASASKWRDYSDLFSKL